jgi:4'-phosphopantetheinyl transferase
MIYINDHIEQFSLNDALQEISQQRRDQALKFKHEQGQRLSVAAYLLLKEGLRQEYGITTNPIFGYHADGKPFLEGHPGIHFNLSHCRQAAICGLSQKPIGVDVESIRQFRSSLVDYTMNEEEVNQIHESARPDVEFIRLWTMKESLLKLSGEGIRNNLKNVLAESYSQVSFTTVINLQKQYIYSICEYR